ncbi:hypothetical protein BOTBODRAFT_432738 [Botryobasidium botryosum FD-172 SS1]|uniref:Uncharacterized protein n=1 Tax=Botryobasidium botryosum (strain FD-172 SS1) TaxID=930990 RepID=A0A067MWY4_BOTB1|nr:hypothetical protein BOTBODRAFT_432738 [Botryobasidium botryosum FD-172 SS1]
MSDFGAHTRPTRFHTDTRTLQGFRHLLTHYNHFEGIQVSDNLAVHLYTRQKRDRSFRGARKGAIRYLLLHGLKGQGTSYGYRTNDVARDRRLPAFTIQATPRQQHRKPAA